MGTGEEQPAAARKSRSRSRSRSASRSASRSRSGSRSKRKSDNRERRREHRKRKHHSREPAQPELDAALKELEPAEQSPLEPKADPASLGRSHSRHRSRSRSRGRASRGEPRSAFEGGRRSSGDNAWRSGGRGTRYDSRDDGGRAGYNREDRYDERRDHRERYARRGEYDGRHGGRNERGGGGGGSFRRGRSSRSRSRSRSRSPSFGRRRYAPPPPSLGGPPSAAEGGRGSRDWQAGDQDRGRYRDAGRSRDRARSREREQQPSQQQPQQDKERLPPRDKPDTLFFDGFQWVKPTGAAGATDRLQSSAAAPGSAQKDRRVHIGNLPLNVGLTAESLSSHICEQMQLFGLCTPALEGSVVSSCWISPEGAYAFLELRSAAEATECLRLQGQPLQGQPIKVSRPNNYSTALPPAGLPLLVPGLAGPPGLAGLAGATGTFGLGPAALDVLSRLSAFPAQALPGSVALAPLAPQLATLPGVELALQAAALASTAQPQRAISLANFALREDLLDDEDVRELREVLADECSKFGSVCSVVVPLASAQHADGPPLVYVQFDEVASAQAALAKMQARAFDGRVLAAAFVSDGEYEAARAAAAAGPSPGVQSDERGAAPAVASPGPG